MLQIDQVGEFYWIALYDLGRIAELDGDIQMAVDYYTRAAAVIEQQRASIYTEAFKIGFVGDKQAVYRGLVSLCFQQGLHSEALAIVERDKARALVDLLAGRKKFRGSPDGTQSPKIW